MLCICYKKNCAGRGCPQQICLDSHGPAMELLLFGVVFCMITRQKFGYRLHPDRHWHCFCYWWVNERTQRHHLWHNLHVEKDVRLSNFSQIANVRDLSRSNCSNFAVFAIVLAIYIYTYIYIYIYTHTHIYIYTDIYIYIYIYIVRLNLKRCFYILTGTWTKSSISLTFHFQSFKF